MRIELSVQISVGFLALCAAALSVQADRAANAKGYCGKGDAESLENRVSRADVIITGTIIQVTTEKYGPSHNVGIVKLWRIVKGSLEHVHNQSIGDQTNSVMDEMGLANGNAANEIIRQPMIKVYGIGNTHVCGSFVTPGDTRIFFLQKFRDVRDVRSDVVFDPMEATPEVLSGTRTANGTAVEKVSKAPTTSEAPADVVGAEKQKKKKKGRGKKGRKKSKADKKKKARKTKRKDKGMTKKKLPKKGKKKQKSKRTSESSLPKWMRKASGGRRPKRSSSVPLQVLRMAPDQKLSRRKERDALDRAVLVINASPARITLENLNSVEKLARKL